MPTGYAERNTAQAKLADLGRAGSTAMQPAATHAINPPAHTPHSANPQIRRGGESSNW